MQCPTSSFQEQVTSTSVFLIEWAIVVANNQIRMFLDMRMLHHSWHVYQEKGTKEERLKWDALQSIWKCSSSKISRESWASAANRNVAMWFWTECSSDVDSVWSVRLTSRNEQCASEHVPWALPLISQKLLLLCAAFAANDRPCDCGRFGGRTGLSCSSGDKNSPELVR